MVLGLPMTFGELVLVATGTPIVRLMDEYLRVSRRERIRLIKRTAWRRSLKYMHLRRWQT